MKRFNGLNAPQNSFRHRTARLFQSVANFRGRASFLGGIFCVALAGCSSKSSPPIAANPQMTPPSERRKRPLRPQMHIASADVTKKARSVVMRHLLALEKGDFGTALKLLSPDFQRSFRDANALKIAISSMYPEYLEAKKIVKFTVSEDTNSRFLGVEISFRTHSSQRVVAFYRLIPAGDSYLIQGISSYNLDRRRPLSPTPTPDDPFHVKV